MSKNLYYEMLDSNEISTIIHEKWQGFASQSFSTLEMSTCFKIINSSWDPEESSRRFRVQIHDSKTYFF